MSHELEFSRMGPHEPPLSLEPKAFETHYSEADVKRLLEFPEAVMPDFKPLGVPKGNNLHTIFGDRHAHISGIRHLEEGPTYTTIHLEEAEPSRALRILSHVVKDEKQRRYKADVHTFTGWTAEDHPNL